MSKIIKVKKSWNMIYFYKTIYSINLNERMILDY